MTIGRREVLGSGLAMLAADVAAGAAKAQSAAPEGESTGYGAAATGQQVTRDFAKFLSAMRYEDLSPASVHEAKRAVLDWTGCALAGSTHPTVGILLRTYDQIGSRPEITVLGHRGKKLGLLDAPVAN